eukprot:4910432-Pleurochrysis_carterae.AAC.1
MVTDEPESHAASGGVGDAQKEAVLADGEGGGDSVGGDEAVEPLLRLGDGAEHRLHARDR